jgi:hypothetical protein
MSGQVAYPFAVLFCARLLCVFCIPDVSTGASRTILRDKGWEALQKHLSFHPVAHFSTARSNGTNKVIDTQYTFLLSSSVYIEAHRRRTAARGQSHKSLQSFNSFISNRFRTLLAQWGAAILLFSNAWGLFPLQWGCIPLYPACSEFPGERSARTFTQSAFREGASSSSTPSSPICSISCRPCHFSSTAYKMLLPQLLCFDNDPFSWGVYPLALFSSTAPRSLSSPATTFLPRHFVSATVTAAGGFFYVSQ